MPPSTRRPTKADAKRARLEAQRQAAAAAQRRARNVRIAWLSAAGAAALAIVVVIVVATQGSGGHKNNNAGVADSTPSSAVSAGATPTGSGSAAASTGTPGRTTAPPWAAPADAGAAVHAAGLSMLSAEGTALHIHAHLDVIANGSPVVVPPEIGIDEAHQQISPLHSHDTSGVIHVESAEKSATFTLGQFFAEWQVALGVDHIGGLVADGTHHLKAYVNGVLYSGDPSNIQLHAHDEIALVYGTDAQQTGFPTSYHWTNGL